MCRRSVRFRLKLCAGVCWICSGSEAFQTAPEYENVRLKLESYLHSSASADYQLAGQMADIFDQYLVYRPDWIDAAGWEAAGFGR